MFCFYIFFWIYYSGFDDCGWFNTNMVSYYPGMKCVDKHRLQYQQSTRSTPKIRSPPTTPAMSIPNQKLFSPQYLKYFSIQHRLYFQYYSKLDWKCWLNIASTCTAIWYVVHPTIIYSTLIFVLCVSILTWTYRMSLIGAICTMIYRITHQIGWYTKFRWFATKFLACMVWTAHIW